MIARTVLAQWGLLVSLTLHTSVAEAQASAEANQAAADPTVAADPISLTAGEETPLLSAAELAQLGLGEAGNNLETVDSPMRFYGFADFSFGIGNRPWNSLINAGRHPSFLIGNFNLYLSKNITDSVRSFGEVRLMFLPHGARDLTTGELTSTEIRDISNSNVSLRWGGILIERVYFEWTLSSWLTMRAGRFLTPYGIWNVDHGSPTVIPAQRPYVISDRLFPERQTGFELLGQVPLGSHQTLGYHLTLSNGRGPTDEVRDLDNNKAVGGRMYWTHDGIGQLKIGASAYFGRETEATETFGLDADGNVYAEETIGRQHDALSLAGDVQWLYRGLHVQAEVITEQRRYTREGRVGSIHPFLGVYQEPQDLFVLGAYVLTGYRFSFLGIMPWMMYSRLRNNDRATSATSNAHQVAYGVNSRPLDAVAIKIEHVMTFWPTGHVVSDKTVHMLVTQLAWAF